MRFLRHIRAFLFLRQRPFKYWNYTQYAAFHGCGAKSRR